MPWPFIIGRCLYVNVVTVDKERTLTRIVLARRQWWGPITAERR